MDHFNFIPPPPIYPLPDSGLISLRFFFFFFLHTDFSKHSDCRLQQQGINSRLLLHEYITHFVLKIYYQDEMAEIAYIIKPDNHFALRKPSNFKQ